SQRGKRSSPCDFRNSLRAPFDSRYTTSELSRDELSRALPLCKSRFDPAGVPPVTLLHLGDRNGSRQGEESREDLSTSSRLRDYRSAQHLRNNQLRVGFSQ